MAVYIILLTLLLLLSYQYDFKHPQANSSGWYKVVLVIFILLAGFRGDIGHDTTVYHSWYNYLPDNFSDASKMSRFEPLFLYVCVLFKKVGCAWIIPQIIFAGIINYFIFRTISKYTNFKFLGVLLYFLISFYYLNCEEIRQAIGFAIVLYGVQYVDEKEKLWKYIMIVLIASGFHYGSALFIVVPLLPNLFKNKLYLASALLVSFSAVVLLRSNFSSYALMIDYLLSIDTVSSYNDSIYLEEVNRSLLNYVNILVIQIISPLLAFYISRTYGAEKDYGKWFLLYLFVAVASIALTLFYRYGHLMSLFYVITICRALQTVSTNKSNLMPKLIISLILLTAGYSTYNTYTKPTSFLENKAFYENFIPYETYKD